MKKIYKTLLVSVFSSTLVINTWGDVFDVTKETDDKGIKGLVNELKKKIKEGGDYKDGFGEVIKTHQAKFYDLVSKYISSKIDQKDWNDFFKEIIMAVIEVNIGKLDVKVDAGVEKDKEKILMGIVQNCFQMPGIAVWVPKGNVEEMKIYIAMKRRALKNGENVADNSGDPKNLLKFSEGMHTERQLVLAALTNNGENVDYGNVSDELKREKSWHKKGGKLYIYLPAEPCHDAMKAADTKKDHGNINCVNYFTKLAETGGKNVEINVYMPQNQCSVNVDDSGWKSNDDAKLDDLKDNASFESIILDEINKKLRLSEAIEVTNFKSVEFEKFIKLCAPLVQKYIRGESKNIVKAKNTYEKFVAPSKGQNLLYHLMPISNTKKEGRQ